MVEIVLVMFRFIEHVTSINTDFFLEIFKYLIAVNIRLTGRLPILITYVNTCNRRTVTCQCYGEVFCDCVLN